MIQNIVNSIHTKPGKYIMSIILGIGLACIFRKSCKNKNCLNFVAPSVDEIDNTQYKFNNKCYKFNSKTISCNPNKRKQVSYA